MAKKKQLWIRNGIVFDPNIPAPDVFDFEYESNTRAKHQYRSGKTKRRKYHGK